MMTNSILSVRRVSKVYHVKQGIFAGKLPLRALQDVDFSLEHGQVVGLVGESGCGKSTLAKILLGLSMPTEGEVYMHGKPIRDIRVQERAKIIQPIFQDPFSSLNPRKNIAQIVGLPLFLRGFEGAEIRRRVGEMLERVGLPQRTLGSFPSQMSGGQRQRVAIARALIAKPQILICDEPTSALDVSVQSQILNLLRELRTELNLSYLLISHDLSVVRHMSDRVMVMYMGRIVEYSDVETLFETPQHPYTKALLETILPPSPGQGLPKLQLRGDFPNPIKPPSGCAFHPRCSLAQGKCQNVRPVLEGSEVHKAACFFKETIN